MSQGDAYIKDHQDGKDHPHFGHHQADHLEGARREIDLSGKEASLSQKGKSAGQKASSERNVTENGTHLILSSPYGTDSHQARTLNLHIRDAGQAAQAQQTSFVVSQTGVILNADKRPVSGLDFSRAVPSDINFVMERPADYARMPAEQQKAFDQMQNQAVSAFIQGDLNRALTLAGVNTPKLENVVQQPGSEAARAVPTDRSETAKPSDLASLSPEASHAVRRINHDMPNNHHGRMSRHQVDHHLPGYQRRHQAPGEREADRTNPEAAARHLKEDQISAQKNMLSETFAPDKQDPYHSMRRQSDHSYSVGRYGTHFNHMHRVFAHALPPEVMEQLGHPPDYSKLSAILKDHPELMAKIQQNVQDAIKNGDIPQAMADRFKSADSLSSLADFTNKLRGQNGEISKEELDKNLPQSVQDGLASQEVERSMKAGATPGETALAHQLGKDTNQLSDAEKKDNKPLMDAAGKFYALGLGKERMDNSDSFHWSTTADGQTIALLAQRMASQIGTVGDCARGPRQTFDQLGFHLPRVVATVQGHMLEQSGLFQEVSDPRPGDYGYRHWNAAVTRAHSGVDKGDAFIVAGRDSHGRLLGANDHHFVVPPDGGRYRGLKFLRPTDEFFKLYGNKNN